MEKQEVVAPVVADDEPRTLWQNLAEPTQAHPEISVKVEKHGVQPPGVATEIS